MGLTVLLHGFGSTPASWRPVAERLGDETVAPRILGHGGPPTAQTFDDEVDRLAQTLRGHGPVVLCGYSMGGRLALGLLLRYPALVARAVLLGTHPGLDSPAEREARVTLDEARARRLEREGLDAFFARWDASPLFARRSPPPREGLKAAGLAAALRRLGLGRMPSRWEALAGNRVPLTWVVGEEDPRHGPIARRAAQRSGSPCVVVPHSDHDVLGCRPDAVAELLETAR